MGAEAVTADWNAVLAEGERLLRAWAGNQPVEREWRLWVDANMPALLSAALREWESAKVAQRQGE